MIPPSELILNPDGSVFHLGLKPEDIAPVCILVGDPDRVEAFVPHFDQVEKRLQRREFHSLIGRIGTQRLMVQSTGIGTDNMDIVLNELDAAINIDLARREPVANPACLRIIRMGTCGAMQPEVALGDIVWSTAAASLDPLHYFYHIPTQLKEEAWEDGVNKAVADAFSSIKCKAKPYVSIIKSNWEGLPPAFAHAGLTLTSAGFYGPQGRHLFRAHPTGFNPLPIFKDITLQGSRFLNFEMETSGIFLLGGALGHQTASLSVAIANRADGAFHGSPNKAVLGLIDKGMGYLLSK